MKKLERIRILCLFAMLIAFVFTGQALAVEPLKVFILAGQSNMEGHGEMNPIGTQGTLEYIYNNDPTTYGHLKDGSSWAVRDDVWIWYKRGGTTLLTGGLSAGYGAYSTTVGPELEFGHVMGDYYDDQVLIIKTAWGGKSLAVDFRPPSSGWSVNPPVAAGDQGFYYQEMLNFVADVLENLETYFPAYNDQGYEIAGFGWHQGWNDRVNQDYADEYEQNMENFINDVRTDLDVPNLPFVIATTGMAGWDETHPRALQLMDAQLAMEDFTTYPEFEGNVAVVDTRDFWRDVAESPADQSYHWNRNAETYYLIGESIAQEMTALIEANDPGVSTPVTIPNGDFETIYKPGSTTITATISSGGWTKGVGPACPIDSGLYNFSDQTTGSVADIPGWVGYDRDGWITWGGTYGRDQTTGNLQGSISTGNNHTPGGVHCYLANGGSWGNPAGGLIVSDASVGNIQSDAIYVLSMFANGSATPVVLKLLANGVEVTPSSSVDPTLSGTHQEFIRVYDAADLTSYVGQAIKIVCGVGRNASGTQTHFDDVSLEYYSDEPDQSIFEMEDGVLNGAVIATVHAGYTGTGFVDYTTSTGSVALTVNVSTAGSYDLSYRYALASGNRPLEIKVNGQVVASSLSFPATGAWTTWGYTATVPVTLNAGNNTVTATGIGSSGANVDHLLVE